MEPAELLGHLPGILGVGLDIVDMDDFTFKQRASGSGITLQLDRNVPVVIHKFLRVSEGHSTVELVALALRNRSLVSFAQPSRRPQQRVEDSLEVKRGPTDDLEHVGGSGLLLKGFTQLIEQPRVLNGDDRLIGECFGKFDLLVGERAYDRTKQHNYANHRTLAHQRNA